MKSPFTGGNAILKTEKAELELKNFYGILLMQNDFFREEIEGLESRLNIEEETL